MKTSPSSQILTIWGFVLILIAAILYFVSKGQFIFAALVTAMIPVMTLARSPEKWWLTAVMLANSGLVIPGAGGNITATMAISAGFCGLALLDRMMHRTDKVPTGAPHKFALALVFLIVGLASYRGWGLKFLGSANWGGMQYLQLLVGLLFFYYSRQVHVSEKWMKRAVYLCFGLVLLPVAITLLSRYIPALGALQAVVKVEVAGNADALNEGGVQRLQSMHIPAAILVYAALLIFDRTLKISWKFLFTGAFAFILAGMSGHRVVIAKLGLVAVIYMLVRWKKIPQLIRVKAAITGVCLLGALYVFAQFLPFGFQRMVTVLPGIHVDVIAKDSAEMTSDWRIDMWKKMLPMIPRYALVGRGVGFDLNEAYGAYTLTSDQQDKHEFFIAVHNYHNGPLWALIDLGGPGAMLLFGFMIAVIWRYGRRLRWNYSPFLASAYVVFYCMAVSHFVFFLLVYGDHKDVIQMAFVSSILEIISEKGTRPASVSNSNQRMGVRGSGLASRGQRPVCKGLPPDRRFFTNT